MKINTLQKLVPSKKPIIRLQNIAKQYGAAIAVDSISLEVYPGESLVLFGPSGCGKTSTLRLIAGLETPDRGEIYLHDRLASTPKKVMAPHKRGISMVFQDLALWPHLTAVQHIDFALPSGKSKLERQAAISKALAMVRLPRQNKYPRQLSGGEKQRLAIARALASDAEILIMDEPFSSLDSGLKDELLEELQTLVAKLGITMIYVTHGWQEAIRVADRIAIMADGKKTRTISAKEFEMDMAASPDKQKIAQKKEPKIIHLEAIS